MADMRTARGGDPGRREQTQQYVSPTIPPQPFRAGAPRRVVTAVVTVDLTAVEWTRVRHSIAAALPYAVPRTVPLEITIPGDELVADAVTSALDEVGHVGPVHVRGTTPWLVDRLACQLDPARPLTVRRYDPSDPWAPVGPYDEPAVMR